MKHIFKRVDEVVYSMFIVLLSALIFMRYSQDVALTKSLIQGGLFQCVLPAISFYFVIKVCISIAQIVNQFDKKTHDYIEPLSSLVLYGASLYFMAFLFKHPHISNHIDIQFLFVMTALLSLGYLISKGHFFAKTPMTTYRCGEHHE